MHRASARYPAPGGPCGPLAPAPGERENLRFGDQSNLALQAVARAPADGYTLLMVATPHAINVTLYEKSAVTVTRDIVPVASINNNSFVLLV